MQATPKKSRGADCLRPVSVPIPPHPPKKGNPEFCCVRKTFFTFHIGCLPYCSSSILVIFHFGRLPFRLSIYWLMYGCMSKISCLKVAFMWLIRLLWVGGVCRHQAFITRSSSIKGRHQNILPSSA